MVAEGVPGCFRSHPGWRLATCWIASARASTRLRLGAAGWGSTPGAGGGRDAGGAGAGGGADPTSQEGHAGAEAAGPVLVLGVGAAGLGGDGSVHQPRLSA